MRASHRAEMAIGDRIRGARKARGLSQADLASLTGMGQTTITAWESGRKKRFTIEELVRIADALRVSVEDLQGGDAPIAASSARFREIPLLSWVSAGRLEDIGDVEAYSSANVEKLAISDLPPGEYFATEVRGDSMDRISPERSRVIVNAADRTPQSGKLYLFSVRGETTYKRFQAEPVARLEPFSTNPRHEPIFLQGDKHWSCIGRVVRSYIDIP